jgi:hypothetical protein
VTLADIACQINLVPREMAKATLSEFFRGCRARTIGRVSAKLSAKAARRYNHQSQAASDRTKNRPATKGVLGQQKFGRTEQSQSDWRILETLRADE